MKITIVEFTEPVIGLLSSLLCSSLLAVVSHQMLAGWLAINILPRHDKQFKILSPIVLRKINSSFATEWWFTRISLCYHPTSPKPQLALCESTLVSHVVGVPFAAVYFWIRRKLQVTLSMQTHCWKRPFDRGQCKHILPINIDERRLRSHLMFTQERGRQIDSQTRAWIECLLLKALCRDSGLKWIWLRIY